LKMNIAYFFILFFSLSSIIVGYENHKCNITDDMELIGDFAEVANVTNYVECASSCRADTKCLAWTMVTGVNGTEQEPPYLCDHYFKLRGQRPAPWKISGSPECGFVRNSSLCTTSSTLSTTTMKTTAETTEKSVTTETTEATKTTSEYTTSTKTTTFTEATTATKTTTTNINPKTSTTSKTSTKKDTATTKATTESNRITRASTTTEATTPLIPNVNSTAVCKKELMQYIKDCLHQCKSRHDCTFSNSLKICGFKLIQSVLIQFFREDKKEPISEACKSLLKAQEKCKSAKDLDNQSKEMCKENDSFIEEFCK